VSAVDANKKSGIKKATINRTFLFINSLLSSLKLIQENKVKELILLLFGIIGLN